MRFTIVAAFVSLSVLLAGCGPSEDHREAEKSAPKAHSVAEYKSLLQKRVSSVDGANINLWQEVSKYEAADDATKIELYNKVESLVK